MTKPLDPRYSKPIAKFADDVPNLRWSGHAAWLRWKSEESMNLDKVASFGATRPRDQFFSALHTAHLKPRGYRKVRHTFSRQRDVYSEYFQFQGSSWNDEMSAWRFYLNCGISFDDLSRRSLDLDFPRTHASARAPHLVPAALPHYDIDATDPTRLVPDIVAVVDACSEYFARRHEYLKEAYLRKDYKWPFLNDPELQSFRGTGAA